MHHEPAAECVFCRALKMQDGPENLVVFRGQGAFIILNRYPYTSGHVMAVPFAHVPTIEELTPPVRAEMIELANHAVSVLRQLYQPQGFNLGINMGEVAGAGIADHVHLHIVPRWAGDTNFMSSVGDTRVLPESLEDTYFRIHELWGRV